MIYHKFTEEQELELIARTKAGNIAARDTLVLSCMNIYRTQARLNTRRCRMEFHDLVNELFLYVLSIAHKYEHSDGKRWHYFAARAVRWRIWNISRSAWSTTNHLNNRDKLQEFIHVDTLPARPDPVDYTEELESVRDCIARLTPDHRRTFNECFDMDALVARNRREISDSYGFKNRSTYQYRVESSINELKYLISQRNPYFPFSLKYYQKVPIPQKS